LGGGIRVPKGIYKRTPEMKTGKYKNRRPQNGAKNPNWKGGVSKDKAKHSRERRHRLGISKKYISMLGISHTKEYKKFYRLRNRTMRKSVGKLLIKTIQLVYEDNIKKYSTLTCYLCLKPIKFGNDHLEHKTPLSRGGTNAKNNLDIACQKCNNKKYNKTEKEYRRFLIK
jgi:5-methylcytosine-specific restriction endonuclease McrA